MENIVEAEVDMVAEHTDPRVAHYMEAAGEAGYRSMAAVAVAVGDAVDTEQDTVLGVAHFDATLSLDPTSSHVRRAGDVKESGNFACFGGRS